MMRTISELPHHLNEPAALRGWLVQRRRQGKIQFLILRDGTGFLQVTLVQGELPQEAFEEADHLPLESALEISGLVRQDSRAPGGVELAASELRILARPEEEYPISPKEHGIDFLLDHRHLWLRHRRPWATLRIRSEIELAIQEFFEERGFVRFDAPLLTPNAVEGTTELFEIDLFGEERAYLSQSGQLYAEAGALAFGKVYTMGPTFRAERSKTRRHLLEFWMIEPEMAFTTHQENMALQEELVSFLVARILERRAKELELLERDPKRLEPAAEGNYPRLTYREAIELLQHLELDVPPPALGDDLGAPHEAAISRQFDRPVFIERYPAKIKAFYMEPDPEDPELVLNDDLLAPEGYGEIIGGSQRIHDLELLKERLQRFGLPEEPFGWYLDLRRYGGVPHSGFGLGLERTVAWIAGLAHVREAIPFPRLYTRLRP
jgi:asparaginyl-tRNA synthetase